MTSAPISERDLVIAATALAHGHTVATGNVRDFGRVAGLVVEDWTR
jgi:tRNA(fMet)-specific endonuclease VapC